MRNRFATARQRDVIKSFVVGTILMVMLGAEAIVSWYLFAGGLWICLAIPVGGYVACDGYSSRRKSLLLLGLAPIAAFLVILSASFSDSQSDMEIHFISATAATASAVVGLVCWLVEFVRLRDRVSGV